MARRPKPKFSSLIQHYPTRDDICDQGRAANWNQCAIRVSVALVGAGFHLVKYNMGPVCKHGHARGAQSLGDYLWQQWGPPTVSMTAGEGRAATRNKTGIVVFKNITGFRNGLGDHIDLWNLSGTRTGEYFNVSKETWFWEIS